MAGSWWVCSSVNVLNASNYTLKTGSDGEAYVMCTLFQLKTCDVKRPAVLLTELESDLCYLRVFTEAISDLHQRFGSSRSKISIQIKDRHLCILRDLGNSEASWLRISTLSFDSEWCLLLTCCLAQR